MTLEQIVQVVLAEAQKTLSADIDKKISTVVNGIQQRVNESSKEKISLQGGQYAIEVDSDGLLFTRNDGKDVAIIVARNGQIGSGTRSPRTVGKGSAHFKTGKSEAIIPSNGKGSTRGMIVEGDGDDDLTYSFRTLSRMNRQGLNVMSDGSLCINKMEKVDNATLGVYHRYSENAGFSVFGASKDQQAPLLKIGTSAPSNKFWKAISVSYGSDHPIMNSELFSVSGNGEVGAEHYYTNTSGYAEMFEWADGNQREENRNGYVVAIDSKGKLKIADEGDVPVGVVVPSAAFIGNTAWNHWHKKVNKDTFGTKKSNPYHLVEWFETETSLLKSFYKDEMSQSYALPENAIEVQTDENGDDLVRPEINKDYDYKLQYDSRTNRPEWATVCLLGTVVMYKGQYMDKRWLTIKSLSDELSVVLIR